MRARDLGTRRGPAITVERREIPYWQKRGWRREGRTYTGSYQTPYAAFQGRIEESRSSALTFYLFNPSNGNQELRPLDLFRPARQGLVPRPHGDENPRT